MKHYISLLELAAAIGCQAQTFTIQTCTPPDHLAFWSLPGDCPLAGITYPSNSQVGTKGFDYGF